MLSIPNKPFMLSVIVLNEVRLNVMALFSERMMAVGEL
jgi:hypothetical protein